MSNNQSFQLFSGTGDLGFLDSSSSSSSTEAALPTPPPPVEVISSDTDVVHERQVPSSVKFTLDPVHFDGLTLLKGRVSTKEVLGLPSSDLVPGVYEGGLKLWEGSLDLVRTLQSDVKGGRLSFRGKRVLELGCGHGLPGIFAGIEGANVVHFQDFNAEVLQHLTVPNAIANLSKKLSVASNESRPDAAVELRYFAGCWSQIHQSLPHIRHDSSSLESGSEHTQASGYDIILMAETIYSVSAQQSLYGLIKKCLSIPDGIVYLAAKKHYFGVGGGTQQFVSMIEEDGFMVASLVAEVANGFSNVREVWKLSVK